MHQAGYSETIQAYEAIGRARIVNGGSVGARDIFMCRV